MKEMEIDLNDLKLLKKIDAHNNNGGNIYIFGNYIYKIFLDNSFFINEKKRNVEYLYKNEWSNPKIISLLYNKGEIVGYKEELIKDAKTFKDGLNDDTLDINQKYRYIKDVFDKLRKFHDKNIFIGDIHLENFIYNSDGGYIIDLDEIRFKGVDDYKFIEYYSVRKSNYDPCSTIVSKNTDNIKATICALSLLYNYDFENISKEYGTNMVEFYLPAFSNDQEFLNNIHQIFNNTDDDSILYFDEILQEKGKIKRKEK